MGRISFYFLFLISAIILYLFLIHEVPSHNYLLNGSAKRAALEIITGSVAHSPVPSPESPPPSAPLLPPAPPPAPSSSAHAPAPPPELPPNIVQDSRTIQELGNTITDDPFGIKKSWSGQNVCDFKGFACDIRPDTGILSVAALDFNGYNFNGPDFQIKDLLEDLTDLAIFHANSNNFTGEVSKEVGVKNINYLYELDLSNNKYTGGFPKSVLEAKNLTFLDLRFNSFSGQVPREVFNLDLDVLFLNNNRFSRQLPHNVGNTSALYLTFANNFFTGPIPRSIGSARNLLEVLFLNNNFSGCIPYEIGLLANTTLFDVSHNNLTGPIPYSFACLAKMQILNLARNKFYGAVPEMICKLPNRSTEFVTVTQLFHSGWS